MPTYDFAKYGATPVNSQTPSTGSYDFAKYGATPVTQDTTEPTQPEQPTIPPELANKLVDIGDYQKAIKTEATRKAMNDKLDLGAWNSATDSTVNTIGKQISKSSQYGKISLGDLDKIVTNLNANDDGSNQNISDLNKIASTYLVGQGDKQTGGILGQYYRGNNPALASFLPPEDYKSFMDRNLGYMGDKLESGILGIGRSLGGTVLGAGELGARGMNAIMGAAGQKQFQAPIDIGVKGNPSMEQLRQQVSTPQNTAEEVGKTIGDIGQFVAPAGEIARLGKGIEGALEATKLPGIIKTVAGVGSKAALEGISTGAIAGAQEGNVTPSVEAQTALATAIPVLSKFAEPLVKIAGKIIPKAEITKLIKPNANAYLFGKDPAAAVAEEGIVAKSWDDFISKIKVVKNDIGKNIDSGIKTAEAANPDKVANIEDIIQKHVQDFGKKTTDPSVWKAYSDKINQLRYDVIPNLETGELEKGAAKDLTAVKPSDIWDTQKKVGKLTQWTGIPGEKDANKSLHKLYHELGVKLDTLVPGTKDLQFRYANMLGAEKGAVARSAVAQRNTGLLASGIGAGVGTTAAGLLTSNDPNQDPVKKGIGLVVGALAPAIGNSVAFRTGLASAFSGGLEKKIQNVIMEAALKKGIGEQVKQPPEQTTETQ